MIRLFDVGPKPEAPPVPKPEPEHEPERGASPRTDGRDGIAALALHAKLEGVPRVSASIVLRPDDDVPLGDAGLVVGSTLAYVFDFGDEWRGRLTVKAIESVGGGERWGVVRRTGTAPPQYPGLDEE